MNKNNEKRVAILGAGAAGLISTKICLENGLVPTCFEMSSDIGGLWNYKAALVNQKGSVMRSTVINTSKENMAFSDFPAPKEYPNYMHNRKLLEYFRLYAQEFGLMNYIRLNMKIESIRKADDYEESGQWVVVVSEKGQQAKAEVFDAVMICNGHHAYPNVPEIKGLNDAKAVFKGEVIHSWQYREPFKYVDKRVMVIGNGNSAGDIATELSRIASQVFLSMRTGMWCAPRSAPGGLPGDYSHITRFVDLIRRMNPTFIRYMFRKALNSRFDHELYAIRPSTDLDQHVFVNEELPNRIASGEIIVKPNYKEFKERSVVFEDDTVAENIDLIVVCTGYTIGFPLFDSSIISVKNNWVDLYQFVFPPHLKHGTLAVIGCCNPLGSLNPVMELQARWVAKVIRGEVKLPSKHEMDAEIAARAEHLRKRFYKSERHTILVDFIPYMDEIAEKIGCRPNLTKYFFTDFKLWKTMYFNGITPYQYRLNGPGSNFTRARELILTQDDRVRAPFKTRTINLQKTLKFNRIGVTLPVLLASFIILCKLNF